MSAPLVFIETQGGEATAGSVGLLAVARSLGGPASAFVSGPRSAIVAERLGAHGADETWYADSGAFDESLAPARVDALARLIEDGGYRTVLFESSVVALEVAARLGVRLEAGVNWDLQGLAMRDGRLVGRRLALGDRLAVEVGWVTDVRIAVFRPGAHEPADLPVAGTTHPLPLQDTRTAEPAERVVDRTSARSAEAGRLATASTIVAGGRGVRDREGMALLEELAEALGGVVGVSLPIADRGWYPHSRQVGQTGQKVRPRLYLACGISGALAHRVGMEKAETILAINSDPSAPIFGICDAGVVGDLHTVVPDLTRLVREARGRAST